MNRARFAARYGPWAVIAGGSDGIGAAFASELAVAGVDIVLLARREAPLEACAESLRERHGVEVRTVAVDLRAPDLVDRVAAATEGLAVGLLIYNAGSPSGHGRFLDREVATAHDMVALNCTAPIALAHHFGTAMRPRGRGGMIFLTSMAGLAGSSNQVAYSATKAFDHVFAEALWHDLHPAGIDVLCLAVGATRTSSVERLGLDLAQLSSDAAGPGAMEPVDVAREGLANLGNGPFWAAGEQNRALLPFFFSPDRAAVVNALSRGAALVHGLEFETAGPRDTAPASGGTDRG